MAKRKPTKEENLLLPLNLPDDKIIKYHREDFLKDEE